eukprot:CAMPEP_0170474356 /NCGR_PEP_ID=MMETSP0123-20130129/16153_1 /TAXON_ID=182087 /ORGANISM="Favella ehrenbergii, Strain Fehren 1" /LENGTH=83 /DNA_ID=CAMNT_0010744077 /DNA_START=21 /DNA_END=269 /DNA_ORIENTATION=+
MDRLEVAQAKVDQTKSLIEDSVSSMSSNVHRVDTKLVPSAIDLALEAKETQLLAEQVEQEENAAASAPFSAASPAADLARAPA